MASSDTGDRDCMRLGASKSLQSEDEIPKAIGGVHVDAHCSPLGGEAMQLDAGSSEHAQFNEKYKFLLESRLITGK